MGDEDLVTEVAEVTANGSSLLEKTGEAMTENKEEGNNELERMVENGQDEETVKTLKIKDDSQGNEEKGDKEVVELKDETQKVNGDETAFMEIPVEENEDKKVNGEKENVGEEVNVVRVESDELLAEEIKTRGVLEKDVCKAVSGEEDETKYEPGAANENEEAIEGGEESKEIIKEKKESKRDQEKEDTSEKESVEEERVSKRKKKSEEKETSEEKVEEDSDDSSEVKDKGKMIKMEKGSKKRKRGKNVEEKVKHKAKEVENKEELKTPAYSGMDRPVRERKSVERLVAIIERDAVKEFRVEKGRGTALKNIPNVASKLSRKRNDDTLKMLHAILFGRRGKASEIKNNISRFSGFVWHGNEEKQQLKVREKFDKHVKEKLLEFCDVLDIPIAKAVMARKEAIITKLIDFLVAPHATTDELLAENEELSKDKKRKREVKTSSLMSGGTGSSHSTKSRRKLADASKEDNKSATSVEDASEGEDSEEQKNEDGVGGHSEDEMPEQSASQEKENESEDEDHPDDKDTKKNKESSKKFSHKKESAGKLKIEEFTTPKRSRSTSKRRPKGSPPIGSKVEHESDSGAKVSSRKKKDVKVVKEKFSAPAPVHSKVETEKFSSPKNSSRKKKESKVSKEKFSAPPPTASKEKTGKKVSQGKDKSKEEKLKPTDKEPTDKVLKDAICKLLNDADFNTETFNDIFKKLAKQFKKDLTLQKSSIKIMVQDELTRLAGEVDED